MVDIPGAGIEVPFIEGETIWTESSHKFCVDELFQIADETNFHCAAQWIDNQWAFAESLFIATY